MNLTEEIKGMFTFERYRIFIEQIIFAFIIIAATYAISIYNFNFGGYYRREIFLFGIMPISPILAGLLGYKRFNMDIYYWIPVFSVAIIALAQGFPSVFNSSFQEISQVYLVLNTMISIGAICKHHWNTLYLTLGKTNCAFLFTGLFLLLIMISFNYEWLIFILILLPFCSPNRSIYTLPAYFSLTMIYFSLGVGDEDTAIFSIFSTLVIIALPLSYQKAKQKWG